MLPKTQHPLTEILIPSLNKKAKFRPWLVKEEQILLMADQSKNPLEIMTATKQVINNCYSDEEPLDINSLTSFDLDWLFLQLRSISVNNIMTMTFRDTEDGETREFSFDIQELHLQYPDNHNPVVEAGDVKIRLKYPSMDIFEGLKNTDDLDTALNVITASCIEQIYDDEEVYEDYTTEELVAWLDEMPVHVLDQIKLFFDTMPKVEWKVEYTNNEGNKRKIVLSSLFDFFTWRSAPSTSTNTTT